MHEEARLQGAREAEALANPTLKIAIDAPPARPSAKRGGDEPVPAVRGGASAASASRTTSSPTSTTTCSSSNATPSPRREGPWAATAEEAPQIVVRLCKEASAEARHPRRRCWREIGLPHALGRGRHRARRDRPRRAHRAARRRSPVAHRVAVDALRTREQVGDVQRLHRAPAPGRDHRGDGRQRPRRELRDKFLRGRRHLGRQLPGRRHWRHLHR